MTKNYFETKKFKVLALVVFGNLLFWALLGSIFTFLAGTSWGAPYSYLTIAFTKSVDSVDDIEVGDRIGYTRSGLGVDKHVAHKVIDKGDNFVFVEVVVYDDMKTTEKVYAEQFLYKILAYKILLPSNDFMGVCIYEETSIGTQNSEQICQNARDWALNQKEKAKTPNS